MTSRVKKKTTRNYDVYLPVRPAIRSQIYGCGKWRQCPSPDNRTAPYDYGSCPTALAIMYTHYSRSVGTASSLVMVCRCRARMLQKGHWQHYSKDFTGATSRSNTASLCDSNQIIRITAHQQRSAARCGLYTRSHRQKCPLTFKSIENEANIRDSERVRPTSIKSRIFQLNNFCALPFVFNKILLLKVKE
jgi:hypothetical protein